MTEEDVIRFAAGLPGVVAETAGADGGAPEIAWGDSFFFYDPRGDTPDDRRFPFATIVTKDYPGFDEASALDRAGVFRVNIAVGREGFRRLFGHPPAAHAEHRADVDHAVLDRVLPHPVYAAQGWACVLNPGEESGRRTLELLEEARDRAARRHRPRS
ncbi:DUF6194 family protein [Actinocorallia populi]|uniref:DUF6194 family protein n=1 Tax=Actinocorallia populi TaxID=2079200 RepID=UPI000D093D8E|nr:DUF6194 family protein [Actinocorallia populi]